MNPMRSLPRTGSPVTFSVLAVSGLELSLAHSQFLARTVSHTGPKVLLERLRLGRTQACLAPVFLGAPGAAPRPSASHESHKVGEAELEPQGATSFLPQGTQGRFIFFGQSPRVARFPLLTRGGLV